MGVCLGLSPKQKFLGTQSLQFNQSISPRLETRRETIAQGWIFLGNINNASHSTLVGKPLIKGSQSTDSLVVPAVGSMVTVSVKPGVTLRNNKPEVPNFNYKEEKALAILKPREKLKILQVQFVSSNTTLPTKKVWAKVQKCDINCN